MCCVIVWSKKLKNEEVMDRVGPQRHSKNNFVGRNVNSRTVKEFVCNVHVYEI